VPQVHSAAYTRVLKETALWRPEDIRYGRREDERDVRQSTPNVARTAAGTERGVLCLLHLDPTRPSRNAVLPASHRS